jgi:ring-1,2-phenylacetyl-CoA epoxidase subunit PaaC
MSAANNNLHNYLLQWADNSLILGQRLGEWCGHGPVLEQDIALINISLDLIGEARNIFQYAASLSEGKMDEDKLAMMRLEHEYKNVLLVERPNGNWGDTIMRQLMFDVFHYYFLQELKSSKDSQIAGIAEKSIKEAAYHLKFSSEWCKRLGDGTAESHEKMQAALEMHYPYFMECYMPSKADEWALSNGIGANLETVKSAAIKKFNDIIQQATLELPTLESFKKGGKNGVHTEAMGYVLAELQYMQRAYPEMQW